MLKDNNKKKALVTGASGFVGSHLTRGLIAKGWDLHLIIRPNCNLNLLGEIHDCVTIYPHDGSSEDTFRILNTVKPDVVFHLASLFLAHHQTDDIEPLIRSNLLFSTQLVDAMVSNRLYRMVNTGTSWQHFENKDYSPVCLYAATKQAFECIIQYYIETSPLRVVTLKLFDTYGPNDSRKKLFHLLENTMRESSILQMSLGEQILDLVYIDDVVAAFILVAERLMEISTEVGGHECYAVSSVEPIKLRDLVQLYEREIGKILPIEWGGRSYRSREVMTPWTNGVHLPGWKPNISLAEGIRRVVSRVQQK